MKNRGTLKFKYDNAAIKDLDTKISERGSYIFGIVINPEDHTGANIATHIL